MEVKETRSRKRKTKELDSESEEPVSKKKISAKTKSAKAKVVTVKKDIVKEKKEPKITKKVTKRNIKPVSNNDSNDLNAENATETNDDPYSSYWNEAEMLSYFENIPPQLAQKFISLLSDGCTLPFIARYRKEAVHHLMPDRYRYILKFIKNLVRM